MSLYSGRAAAAATRCARCGCACRAPAAPAPRPAAAPPGPTPTAAAATGAPRVGAAVPRQQASAHPHPQPHRGGGAASHGRPRHDAGASTAKAKAKARRSAAHERRRVRAEAPENAVDRGVPIHFGETTGDPTLYDRMPPENRAAVHAMIDAKTAELEEDQWTRQQEERRFRETQAQLAFGPTLQNDDEEGELDLELDEEIRLMAFSLDAVVFSTDPIGKNADGVLQYAQAYDYGVLRSLDHETLLKVMGSGDVQMGQLMVNLWYLTVRDLQRVGVEVCIVQDGALMDIVHALGQLRPDKDALVDNDREGTTLLDCFTHPPGMAPTTPLPLNDPRLRTHIFTDDPEFGAYSSEPTFAQTDSEWIASGATPKRSLSSGCAIRRRGPKPWYQKPIAARPDGAGRGRGSGRVDGGKHRLRRFYQTDLRGTGHENALSQVGVRQKGAEARPRHALRRFKWWASKCFWGGGRGLRGGGAARRHPQRI